MNRTALALMMLRILKTRSLVKKQDLADLLETNPRNIIELKKELEIAGYPIDYKPGPNGGYQLAESGSLIVPDLTSMETIALQEVLSYLRSTNTTLRKEAEEALEKVLSAGMSVSQKDNMMVSGTRLSMDYRRLQQYYEIIRTSIYSSVRLKVSYRPRNKEIKEWIIHPYGLFLYRDMWYMVGYREYDKVITMKLNRIVNLEQTTIKFHKPDDFNIRDYVSNYGLSIGEKQRVRLLIRKRYYLSEYLYGEDQIITPIDDDTVLFEVTMQGDISIKQFVLNLGADCEVLEPQWLKDEILQEAEKIINQYK